MGKLVGLLGSGIGLAIEATTSYQSSRQPGKTNYDSRSISSHLSPVLPRIPPDRSPKDNVQGDANTFRELQEYAEYQNKLLDNIDTEFAVDDPYSAYPAALLYNEEIPSKGRLPHPVIIPQRRPGTKDRGWRRAYAPVLMSCGIDQDTFLHFLDSFNEASKASPYLDVVNVAAAGVGFAPGIAPMVVSMVVPAAVMFAKTAQTNQQSDTFLKRANRKLFEPHGLFAMVMTYKPEEQASNFPVDTSQQGITTTQVQLPQAAPLVFPCPESHPSSKSDNQFRKISHFVADYGDRRAQARYANNNSESALVVGPAPSFQSRWGEPDHPANNSGLVTLLSGRVKGRSEKDRKNDEKKAERLRRRGSRSSGRSNKRDSLMTNVFESTFAQGRSIERPSLIRGVRGMVNKPGKENQGLIKGIKGLGMQTDVLYLLIVNHPSDDEIGSSTAASSGYQIQDPLPSRFQQRRQQTGYRSDAYSVPYTPRQREQQSGATSLSDHCYSHRLYEQEDSRALSSSDYSFEPSSHAKEVDAFQASRSPPPQYTP